MKLLEPIDLFEKKFDNSHLKLLFPNMRTREEIIYRSNGKSVDKIIEFDIQTGSKVKTTYYDYFDENKIRSIDEFDKDTGKKIRTINYVLYKSVDEYDIKTGQKVRTINFNVKDDSKISSIQEYDLKSGKIIKISIYKRDGRTVNIVKDINPETNKATDKYTKNIGNYKFVNNVKTRSYKDIEFKTNIIKEDVAKLIDNLYKNKLNFENI